jgi:hypothetical protein
LAHGHALYADTNAYTHEYANGNSDNHVAKYLDGD